MLEVQKFLDMIKKSDIQIKNVELKNIIQNYHFLSFCNEINTNQKIIISKNLNESNAIIINCYENSMLKTDNIIIIGFKNTILFVKETMLPDLINNIFSIDKKMEFYFLADKKNISNQFTNGNIKEVSNTFELEIDNFNQQLQLTKKDKLISCRKIWELCCPCISGYLIKDSYQKLSRNKITDFYSNKNKDKYNIEMNKNTFFELRTIAIGSNTIIKLIYNIDDKSLYVLKTRNISEDQKCTEREINNYLKIQNPFIPKFYGKIGDNNILIEFINGHTLNEIGKENIYFSKKEKLAMIMQFLSVMKYLHDNKFIYRDLKPSNVMIDSNKTIVLIDFDRMIEEKNEEKDDDHTGDLSNFNPDFDRSHLTIKTDIFAMSHIINCILNDIKEIEGDNSNNEQAIDIKNFQPIQTLIERCLNENAELRPSDSELIDCFYEFIIQNGIILETIDPISQFEIGEKLLEKNDKEKSIQYFILSAKHNYSLSQCILGYIYLEGKHVQQNIEKSIQYLTLAANQNSSIAQLMLGIIYLDEKYVPQNINKAIYYLLPLVIKLKVIKIISNLLFQIGWSNFEREKVSQDIEISISLLTIAALLNNSEAQYKLGLIYLDDKYKLQDIEKAIHYLALAANNNNSEAQCKLGSIYLKDKYKLQDIEKAIHYFTLAANNNNSKAQYKLGSIYMSDEYKSNNKVLAFIYYILSAENDYPKAQYLLGWCYLAIDINKSIHYLKLASNNNHSDAQFFLGMIYLIVQNDVNKSIHYFSRSAYLKNHKAQLFLGKIYIDGDYVPKDIDKGISIIFNCFCEETDEITAYVRLGNYFNSDKATRCDINKSIFFYEIAARKNNSEAQYNLGFIYLKDKKDINKAKYYLNMAAHQNQPYAQYLLGFLYFILADIPKSIYYLKLAAEQNIFIAYLFLGFISILGIEVPQDDTVGNRYIYNFLHYQNFDDQYIYHCMSLLYNDGGIFPKDLNKVVYFYKLAANLNNKEAQYNLSQIYSDKDYKLYDINKSIYYCTLAANQGFPPAQFKLGQLYYVSHDINKSIHYLSLAADQKYANAQFGLGVIYLFEDKYLKDRDKAIQYLHLAAQQNHSKAEALLGKIYYDNKYVKKDIYKAMHYFDKAANKNEPEALFYLGNIYLDDNNIKQNIDKSINYFLLAANQKHSGALNNLGYIYSTNKYVQQDIEKSIHYYKLAADQNEPTSLLNLSKIYLSGTLVPKDIKKAFYYLKLSAVLKNNDAQYLLGIYYLHGFWIPKNIKKGLTWIKEASEKYSHFECFFILGACYHQGKYLNQDIEKSKDCYAKASSFKDQYAKNNLGIMYKHGFKDLYKKNIANAEMYFMEAINENNDCVAMYNLAHMYIYEESTEESINKSIDLLIRSSNEFLYSQLLLIIALIKKHGNKIGKMINETQNLNGNIKIFIHAFIYIFIILQQNGDNTYEDLFHFFRNIDFLYDMFYNIIKTELFCFKDSRKNINESFFDGFGIDI